MKALISPNEPCASGFRIAEVSSNSFDVAEPLFWIDCSDEIVPDLFWFDPNDQTVKPTPEPESIVTPLQSGNQPTVNGAQTL